LISLLLFVPYQKDPAGQCYSLEDIIQKDNCLYAAANVTESVSYCHEINNESMRDDCEYAQFLVYKKKTY
jgi:hypothetical protein